MEILSNYLIAWAAASGTLLWVRARDCDRVDARSVAVCGLLGALWPLGVLLFILSWARIEPRWRKTQ